MWFDGEYDLTVGDSYDCSGISSVLNEYYWYTAEYIADKQGVSVY